MQINYHINFHIPIWLSDSHISKIRSSIFPTISLHDQVEFLSNHRKHIGPAEVEEHQSCGGSGASAILPVFSSEEAVKKRRCLTMKNGDVAMKNGGWTMRNVKKWRLNHETCEQMEVEPWKMMKTWWRMMKHGDVAMRKWRLSHQAWRFSWGCSRWGC